MVQIVNEKKSWNSKIQWWAFLVFLAIGCDVINPDEDEPAILKIEEFTLNTNTVTEGSASEKITEAWLTVNGEFLGAYSLPARIPVLSTGPTRVKLEAGIRDNGISRTPEIYPFYEIFETDVDLNPLINHTIAPAIGYLSNAKFALVEDFESGNSIFSQNRILDGSTIIPVETDVFEGDKSGRITLTEERPVAELATLQRYSRLNSASPFVYLEVNYKSEVPVAFGIIGYAIAGDNQGTAFLEQGFLPKAEWNKIYFNLSSTLAENEFAEYQIGLQAFIPETGEGSGLERAEVLLDNIKLLHF